MKKVTDIGVAIDEIEAKVGPLRVLETVRPDAQVKITTSEERDDCNFQDGNATTYNIKIEVPDEYISKRIH